MKKLGIIGGIIVLLFIGIIVLTNLSNEDKLKDNPYGTDNLQQPTIDLLDDKNYQNIILPGALQEKIATGEPVFAYLFSPTCEHCKNMTPKLMEVAKELDLQIDQLNVLEYGDGWQEYNIKATPTLLYFNGGAEVQRLVGDYDKDSIHQFFASLNLK